MEMVKNSIGACTRRTKVNDEVEYHATLDLESKEPFDSITNTVRNLLEDNILHFKTDDSDLGQRIFCGLYAIQDAMPILLADVAVLEKECSQFDLSSEEPGNGFRSTVSLGHEAVMGIFSLLKQISMGRSSLLFRKTHYVKEVEAWSLCLTGFCLLTDYMKNCLLQQCETGNLIPENTLTPTEFIGLINTIYQYGMSMYGRCFAFQYPETLRRVFKAISISMCTFSEAYYNEGGIMQRTKQSIVTGSKYILSPEKRARRLVDLMQYCSVDFMKAFWAMNELELLNQVNSMITQYIPVEQHIIVPCQDIEIETIDGGLYTVPTPSSHILPNPISCYLLSASHREGMVAKSQKNVGSLPPSDTIIFHCHGGGFISQSTKVQSIFLKAWASKLNIPIFSIDYSLAPEAKYPRQLEEIFSVYAWLLKNVKSLGSTGAKIILTGDSAGGNLQAALTVKCIENKIRPPDGIFFIYTPFKIQLCTSPARIISAMDPLLPVCFTMRCLRAYNDDSPGDVNDSQDDTKDFVFQSLKGGADEDMEEFILIKSNDHKDKENVDISNGSVKSPDTLTTISLSSSSSPTLESPTSDVDRNKEETEAERRARHRKYVESFFGKYSLEYIVDKGGRSLPIFKPLDESEKSEAFIPSFSDRIGKAKDAVKGSINAGITTLGLKSKSEQQFNSSNKTVKRQLSIGKINLGSSSLDNVESSLMEFCPSFNQKQDYYQSPYCAPADILAKFPPSYFLTSEYDFALDDTVMMAKKLRSLGVPVRFKCCERLPHGFLNICLAAKEAFDGSKDTLNFLQELVESVQ